MHRLDQIYLISWFSLSLRWISIFLFRSLISLLILIQIEWFLILWISLGVLFFKNINFSHFHPNSSSSLIKFWRYLKNFSMSPLIWPLLIIVLINSWLNHQISEFGIFFYVWTCVLTVAHSCFVRELFIKRTTTIYCWLLYNNYHKINHTNHKSHVGYCYSF